jgi:hypothetical protein
MRALCASRHRPHFCHRAAQLAAVDDGALARGTDDEGLVRSRKGSNRFLRSPPRSITQIVPLGVASDQIDGRQDLVFSLRKSWASTE